MVASSRLSNWTVVVEEKVWTRGGLPVAGSAGHQYEEPQVPGQKALRDACAWHHMHCLPSVLFITPNHISKHSNKQGPPIHECAYVPLALGRMSTTPVCTWCWLPLSLRTRASQRFTKACSRCQQHASHPNNQPATKPPKPPTDRPGQHGEGHGVVIGLLKDEPSMLHHLGAGYCSVGTSVEAQGLRVYM